MIRLQASYSTRNIMDPIVYTFVLLFQQAKHTRAKHSTTQHAPKI